MPGPVVGSRKKTVNEIDIASFFHKDLSIVRKKDGKD